MVSLSRRVLVLLAASALVFLGADAARGDPASSTPGLEARQHFNLGTEAFRRGDFLTAGQEFDRAYATAPHPDALWNAAQAWERSQELARAANRYALFLEFAPPSAPDRDRATAALARLAPRLGRLEIHASASAPVPDGTAPILTIDGEPARLGSDFVYPGAHEVVLRDGKATQRRGIGVDAGMVESIAFLDDATEPAPAAPLGIHAPSVYAPEIREPVPAHEDSGLPRWVVVAGGASTLVALGFTVWSGIDTLSEKSIFVANPTAPTLAEGRSSEVRTNVLLGLTVGLGVATIGSAFFVHWRPRASPVSVGFGAGTASLSLRY
jgi:hypothetical protein